MASVNDIILAFQRSGIGRGPTEDEINFYSSYADAGKVEGDIRAGGGGASGGTSTTPFSFDQKAAEEQAKKELEPYYKRLLEIYDGDVALAKKRMEEDYARGLRYKQEDTATGLGDIAANKAERDRKFKLALGDLDQEMNTRGLTTSGIKATNVQNAKADEAFQQQQLANQARDLTQEEKRYIESADIDKQRWLEEEGFANTGIAGYADKRKKKVYELGHQFEEDVGTKVGNALNKAVTYFNVGQTPLQNTTPTNYSDLLNTALKTAGLPTTS